MYRGIFILIFSLSLKCLAQIDPYIVFDSLFHNVQMQDIFSDQKKFADCKAIYHPDTIRAEYLGEKNKPGFNLRDFVGRNFDTVFADTSGILRHIDFLWQNLMRSPDKKDEYSSLIPLPYNYIVPGGRFREIYYWDSYFTMLGLAEAGKYDLIEELINNFSFLTDKYGFIPNGNRTYYLSRSQPPFYSLMIDLLAEKKGDSVYIIYLPFLEKEYNFWMKGIQFLSEKKENAFHVVKVSENNFLNRYWDSSQKPRPESYRQDLELFLNSGKDSSLFREIRSAAESGWDFSSRWFEDGMSLSQINTTSILPVDLNCLLYHLEETLSKAYVLNKDVKKSVFYSKIAGKRKELINKYFWNEEKGFYFDYNSSKKEQTEIFSLAGIYPLFFGIASDIQAKKAVQIIENDFLKAGGVVATLYHTGQQWDYPNGWAPLQWITYKGLKNYNHNAISHTIAQRWLNLNIKVYLETGKMMEKYDVVDIYKPGGGGEYPLQDGFGWTNGVFLKLWNEMNK